jgi:hypothetical protein
METFKYGRPLNMELVEKYGYLAQFYGERDAKKDLAAARRTATSLDNAARSFTQLADKEKKALVDAASAMRRLAVDLQAIVIWAKAFLTHCESERKKESDALCQREAHARWNGDALACAFEASILEELGTNEGRISFANWMHSNGRYLDVMPENFTFHVRMEHGDCMEAKVIRAIQDESSRWGSGYDRTFDGRVYFHVDRPTYDQYLVWRRSIADIAQTSLTLIATGHRKSA